MKEQRTLNMIAIALIIAALLVLLVFSVFFKQEKIDVDKMAEVSSQINELTKQKKTLEAQISEIESKYRESIKTTSTEQFLISDANIKIYEGELGKLSLYDLFKSYSLTGVISVSSQDFSVSPHRLGAKKISEMLENGWSCCIKYNGGDLTKQLNDIRSVTERNGIEMPKSIYFADSIYESDFDEILINHGITTVIHSNIDKYPFLVTDCGEGEIWHIGITPWNGDDIQSTIEELISEGANAVFEINFDEESDAVYDVLGFQEMLSYIADDRAEGSLEITDFETAREYLRESKRLADEYNESRNEYQKQLDDINSRVDELSSIY